MIKTVEVLLKKFEEELDFLESEKEEILDKAEEGILIAKLTLEKLRNNVVKNLLSNYSKRKTFRNKPSKEHIDQQLTLF